MIDFARITVKAGNGGNGCGSFLRIKGKRYGKADGGDGGRGGDVYVEATGDLSTLEPYRYVKDYKAENGGRGLPNHCRGADGENLVLKVPVGTVVGVTKVIEEPEEPKDSFKKPVAHYDLTEEGKRVLVARGGECGRGNAHLRDEFGRRPKVGEPGQEGEQVQITLELKLLADVGLIGLPNAGKSTLLSKLTAARPKIAAYPFTTLEPNLGVMNGSLGNWAIGLVGRKNPKNRITQKPKNLILADIPGLIEGASRGRGLGDLFLRHIERTKVLVHLVDVSVVREEPEEPKETNVEKTSGSSGSFGPFVSLWGNYQTVRNELKAYSGGLAKKPEIMVLTKVDLIDGETLDAVTASFKKRRKKVIATSAETGEGLAELVSTLVRAVAR